MTKTKLINMIANVKVENDAVISDFVDPVDIEAIANHLWEHLAIAERIGERDWSG